MSAHGYEPGRVGLLLIDTVNDVFSEGGKGCPTSTTSSSGSERARTSRLSRRLRTHVLHRSGLHLVEAHLRCPPRDV